jgi:hypothetical protein
MKHSKQTFKHHCSAAACGNTPVRPKVSPHTTVWHHRPKAFYNSKHNLGEASTQTRGGDTFGVNLPNDHRFVSKRLNLAFEGLLLGASQRHHMVSWAWIDEGHPQSFRPWAGMFFLLWQGRRPDRAAKGQKPRALNEQSRGQSIARAQKLRA